MDEATLFKESNKLFITCQYEQALPLLRQYDQLEELTNLKRLRNKRNIADCLLDVHRGRGEGDWAVEFRNNLQQYWQLLEQVNPTEISPQPLLAFFAVTLEFHLEVESLEQIGDKARATYREFARRSPKLESGILKVRDAEFLDVVVAEIERERRNFARPDHARRAPTSRRPASTVSPCSCWMSSWASRHRPGPSCKTRWTNARIAQAGRFRPMYRCCFAKS